jgi:hypothetical protein
VPSSPVASCLCFVSTHKNKEKFPDRGEDSGIIHWVLVDKNNAKKKGDDTALLMFHSDDFASFRNNPSNPFFSSYEENQVILDYEENPMMIFEFV